MMVVATQYMSWLSAAAVQAEQAATQAAATASAFEAAVVSTVQPAVVAANRGLVQMLAASNFFGMNWPAIMDTESAYEQMWALDVAAMANYHFDASAAAAQLAPWQQVLRNLGIDIGKNGQINFGFGNTGSGNLGNNNFGNNNLGSGNTGSGNIGSGNTGSNNVGVGNTSSNNLGFGDLGSNSVGFGNTGSESFGMGLTGVSKFGYSGFIPAVAIPGSATRVPETPACSTPAAQYRKWRWDRLNRGLGNSISGNIGSESTNYWRSGIEGFGNAVGAEGLAALPTTPRAVLGTAALRSGLIGSALANTGGLHSGLADVLNSGLSSTPVIAPASASSSGINGGPASLPPTRTAVRRPTQDCGPQPVPR